jgi:hypothetical protein
MTQKTKTILVVLLGTCALALRPIRAEVWQAVCFFATVQEFWDAQTATAITLWGVICIMTLLATIIVFCNKRSRLASAWWFAALCAAWVVHFGVMFVAVVSLRTRLYRNTLQINEMMPDAATQRSMREAISYLVHQSDYLFVFVLAMALLSSLCMVIITLLSIRNGGQQAAPR